MGVWLRKNQQQLMYWLNLINQREANWLFFFRKFADIVEVEESEKKKESKYFFMPLKRYKKKSSTTFNPHEDTFSYLKMPVT